METYGFQIFPFPKQNKNSKKENEKQEETWKKTMKMYADNGKNNQNNTRGDNILRQEDIDAIAWLST
jgi:hypothetical protein